MSATLDPEPIPGLCIGWYDPDKTRPTIEKVRRAAERFRERWGVDADFVLTNMHDAAELDGCEFEVRPATFVSRYTYYVGLRP